jgi:tetratricopeptide (TPR) repeat protein
VNPSATPEQLYNHGNTLFARREPQAALQAYEQALALRPDFPEALNNRGQALLALGDLEAAVASFDQAARSRPEFVLAHINRGDALSRLQRPDEALTAYQRAAELQPYSADTLCRIGAVLLALDRSAQARTAFEFALGLAPSRVDALNGLTNACLELREWPAAAQANARALELAPTSAEAHTLQGNLVLLTGEHERAMRCFERALELDRGFESATLNQAFILLLTGRLVEGWHLYETRLALGKPPRTPRRLPPRAESLPHRQSLLLTAEQGLGDTLQFCRYALELQRQEVRVTLEVPSEIKTLICSVSPHIRVIDREEATEPHDWYCPLLSAPRLCGTTLTSIPAGVPYLSAPADRIERWAAVSQTYAGTRPLRIGLNWAGNPAAERRLLRGRSLSLTLFEPLFELPGVAWYSLQKGPAEGERARLKDPERLHVFEAPFDEGTDAFLDSSAVMMHLDLVISSDSAVAHLAGALGVPTWLLLHDTPDWRWLLEREDSPWYPTMRLFRQTRGGSWSAVIARVRDALSHLQSTKKAAMPQVRPKQATGPVVAC